MRASFFFFFFIGLILCGFEEPFTLQPEEIEAYHAGNEYRSKHRRDTLILDTFLCRLAREHSENMAKGKTRFGHSGFDDRYDRISEVLSSNGAAENVFMSHGMADGYEAIDAWIHSKGHRENLLGKHYTRVGLGMATGKKGTFYTQIFAR